MARFLSMFLRLWCCRRSGRRFNEIKGRGRVPCPGPRPRPPCPDDLAIMTLTNKRLRGLFAQNTLIRGSAVAC
eukprot:scaffold107361_cov48-Phaeocystis_antarctica.AAC.1